MAGHGHSHNCADEHEHDKVDNMGTTFSLYLKIDTMNVECLNESVDGSAKTIFKPWDERHDKEKFVESDCDEELLFNIPFTGNVKLKGIIVIGGEDETHPSVMKLYKNRPHMTFDDVTVAPDQEFEMQPDYEGVLEYATKPVKFSSTTHLSIYFPKNFGADTTKVYYMGLRGEFTQAHRHEVTICSYEARANPSDHKTNLFEESQHSIGGL